MMQETRRGFITGLGALFVAAPAIVRAASIMPVKAIEGGIFTATNPWWTGQFEENVHSAFGAQTGIMNELEAVARRAFVPRLFVQVYEMSPVMLKLQRTARSYDRT